MTTPTKVKGQNIDRTDTNGFVSTSAGAGDAGKVPVLDGTGKLDSSFITQLTKASTAQAVAGTDDTTYMTPLKVKESIDGGDWDCVISPIFTKDNATATANGGTPTANFTLNQSYGAGHYRFVNTNSNQDFYVELPVKPGTSYGTNTPNRADISVLELDFSASYNGDYSVGFAAGAGIGYPVTATGRKVFLSNVSNVVKLNTADNTTQSYGADSTGNFTNMTKYKMTYTVGTDAKIYVDGVLKDTKSTNLPTGASVVYFMIGGSNNGAGITLQNMKIRIKYA